jgi:hypothetical protein
MTRPSVGAMCRVLVRGSKQDDGLQASGVPLLFLSIKTIGYVFSRGLFRVVCIEFDTAFAGNARSAA